MAHQLIHGLVYSPSQDHALKHAKQDIFHPLVQKQVFDRFDTFEPSGYGVSAREKWGDLPAAILAEKPLGQELIDLGWMSTVTEYQHGLNQVQEFLDNHETNEIWNDKEIYNEYQTGFQQIGERQGSSTFLYDPEGQGIRTRDHLDYVLSSEETRSEELENLDLYVVSVDVRY